MKLNILALSAILTLSTFLSPSLGQVKPPKIKVGPVFENKQVESKIDKNKATQDGPVTFKFERGFDHTAVAIELSPDGKLLATGGLDKDVRLYSTKDWTQLAKSDAPEGIVLDLLFSEDGKQLVSCGDPKQVLVFETRKLDVLFSYKPSFRPERITEAPDGRVAIVGRSGSRAFAGLTENTLGRGDRIHNKFIGGAASSKDPKIVYTAGDQISGPYYLARKNKTLQKLVSLPGRPARVSMGRDDREVLVTTETKALAIDVVRKKIVETWEIPKAQKIEDIIYWAAHDVYVTSDKSGFVRIWMRGQAQPIAQHQVSAFDVYQVVAVDENRLAFCGRETAPRSITIWNLSFDKSKMPKTKAVDKLAENVTPEVSKTEDVPPDPKVAAVDVPKEQTKEQPTKPLTTVEETKVEPPIRSPAAFVALNSEFEVKRISPTDLGLRKDQPSTKAELEWKITQLEAAGKPIPDELKEFQPIEIRDAIVSPGKGTLYLATSEGLVSFDGKKTKLIREKDNKVVQAKCLARDPVDGILIGQDGGHSVFELRESGKLVNRGKIASENSEGNAKKQLSVDRIVMSGSNYLALASAQVYRRLSDGEWVSENLKASNPIVNFELLETGEIMTSDQHSAVLTIHPPNGKPRQIQLTNSTQNPDNRLARASSLRTKKIIAGNDGDLFCVFEQQRSRNATTTYKGSSAASQPVTCGSANLVGSVFNNTVTHHDLDWAVVKPHRTVRLIIDLLPGPSKESGDLWFITPTGMGRLKDGKSEFWESQFAIDEEGVELTSIRALGDGSFMVFTSDGVHANDAFHVRPIKRK